MVRTFLNNYFGFNRQQRNGLIVLMCISLFLLIVRISYPYFLKPPDMLIQDLPVYADTAGPALSGETEPALFNFDPNTASEQELLQLGFPEKTAATIIKFRRSFTFYEKKDLLKVYGVSPSHYKELEPFIAISEQKQNLQPSHNTKHQTPPEVAGKQTTAQVELNSADSAALTRVPGIGPVFARRIVKYRNSLGGFVRTEQLIEVYGFDEEKYSQVEPHITLKPGISKKIHINTDDFKTVNRHPYISYELTKKLFDWRRKTTLNATNLKEIVADNALFEKLLPYLEF